MIALCSAPVLLVIMDANSNRQVYRVMQVNNKMVRNRVSNTGNLFHLVKCHSINRNLHKETIIMNQEMVFAILITNYRKYEQVGVKTDN